MTTGCQIPNWSTDPSEASRTPYNTEVIKETLMSPRKPKNNSFQHKQNKPVVAPSKRDIERRGNKFDRKMKVTSNLSVIKSL